MRLIAPCLPGHVAIQESPACAQHKPEMVIDGIASNCDERAACAMQR